jgi:hypothetical protein
MPGLLEARRHHHQSQLSLRRIGSRKELPVNDLLDFGRWYEASSVSASVHVRGRFWAFKGQHDRLGVHQSFLRDPLRCQRGTAQKATSVVQEDLSTVAPSSRSQPLNKET